MPLPPALSWRRDFIAFEKQVIVLLHIGRMRRVRPNAPLRIKLPGVPTFDQIAGVCGYRGVGRFIERERVSVGLRARRQGADCGL
jgi:hypothetical protein